VQHSVSIKIRGQNLELLPQKAILWKDTQTLILSDLHLGKAAHFRKSGIPAPEGINRKNIVRLDALLKDYTPRRLLILGDLFHSDANREWLDFEQFAHKWSAVEILLIRGNHDLLHSSFYDAAGITSLDSLEESGFLFLHDTDSATLETENSLTVSGHIHPGVRLRGKARQSLRFPCYLISSKKILLPAFGEFTGLHTIKAKQGETIYAIAENKVIPL
jgi:DNA ligase-associated metallophosphoesterase